MASTILHSGQRFPVGTSVGAYPASRFGPGALDRAPASSPVATASVAGDSSLRFDGLHHEPHFAYALVGGKHVYVSFVPNEAEEGAGWSVYTGAINGAPFSVYGAQDNQVVYDEDRNATWVAYMGPNNEPYVFGIDHENEVPIPPTRVGPYNQLSIEDTHGVPSMAQDDQGYLHIIYGVHGAAPLYAKSTLPNSNAGWNQSQLSTVVGTYHSLCFEPVSKKLIAFFRRGGPHIADGGTPPDVHEYGGLLISSDRGAAWSAQTVLDTSLYSTDNHEDAYCSGCQPAPNGKVLLTYTIAHGTTHDGTRSDQFAMLYDPATNHLYTMAGADLGTVVDTQAEILSTRAATVAVAEVAQARIDENGNVLMVWPAVAGDGKIGTSYAYWNGSSWRTGDVGARTKHIKSRASCAPKEGGGFTVYCMTGRDTETIVTDTGPEAPYYGGAGADLSRFTTEDGVNFVNQGVIVHRSQLSGQGALAVTTPLNASHPQARAVMCPAVPYGTVPHNLPVYVVTEEAVSPQIHALPLKVPITVYFDSGASVGTGSLQWTAGFVDPPSVGNWATLDAGGGSLVPENAVEVLLRVVATADGTTRGRSRVNVRQKGTTLTDGAQMISFPTDSYPQPPDVAAPLGHQEFMWCPVGSDKRIEYKAEGLKAKGTGAGEGGISIKLAGCRYG